MANDKDVVIAQCSKGALFETRWWRWGSFKAARFGKYRLQRCPVHQRFQLIHQVDPSTLTAEQRAAAADYPAGPMI